MTTRLPSIAATVTFRVADFDAWKATFDSHEDGRRRAGIRHRIHRGTDDPDLVCLFAAGGDRAKLQSWLAGVCGGAPSIALLVPQEDRTVEDVRLAAAMVVQEVEDYEWWKAMFDASGEGRTRAGVVGHAIHRSATNPNLVILYAQAGSSAQLRALLGSRELEARMQRAGAVSVPQISYFDPG